MKKTVRAMERVQVLALTAPPPHWQRSRTRAPVRDVRRRSKRSARSDSGRRGWRQTRRCRRRATWPRSSRASTSSSRLSSLKSSRRSPSRSAPRRRRRREMARHAVARTCVHRGGRTRTAPIHVYTGWFLHPRSYVLFMGTWWMVAFRAGSSILSRCSAVAPRSCNRFWCIRPCRRLLKGICDCARKHVTPVPLPIPTYLVVETQTEGIHQVFCWRVLVRASNKERARRAP